MWAHQPTLRGRKVDTGVFILIISLPSVQTFNRNSWLAQLKLMTTKKKKTTYRPESRSLSLSRLLDLREERRSLSSRSRSLCLSLRLLLSLSLLWLLYVASWSTKNKARAGRGGGERLSPNLRCGAANNRSDLVSDLILLQGFVCEMQHVIRGLRTHGCELTTDTIVQYMMTRRSHGKKLHA